MKTCQLNNLITKIQKITIHQINQTYKIIECQNNTNNIIIYLK